ncbi:hypothetical protein [Streptomyces lydicus]|uniref:hypothetical protein n=1 Tax=Streptomyces lydicus TaxID=47763 RepID=UPI0036EED6C7
MSMWDNLTDDRSKALHWAAVAYGLKRMNERNGDPLRGDSLAAYEQYQAAAREHGFTDADVRKHHAKLAAA